MTTTPQNLNGQSESKPLGSTPPAAPAAKPSTPAAVVPPAPVVTAGDTPPAPKPAEPPKPTPSRGPLTYVSTAEEVEALLGDGKDTNAVMPRSAIKKIKESFIEKGRTNGQAELVKQLEAQGFKTIEEALLAASEAKTLREAASNAVTPPKPDEKNPDGTPKKKSSFIPGRGAPAPVSDLEKKNIELARDKKNAERKRDEAMATLEQERADNRLKTECLHADVHPDDVDYVLDKMRLHIGGLDDAALATFDTSKWFEGMKQKQPYLFKGTPTPAVTGTVALGNTPPAPTPARVAAEAEKPKNANEMTKAEFAAHKQKLGVRRSF